MDDGLKRLLNMGVIDEIIEGLVWRKGVMNSNLKKTLTRNAELIRQWGNLFSFWSCLIISLMQLIQK